MMMKEKQTKIPGVPIFNSLVWGLADVWMNSRATRYSFNHARGGNRSSSFKTKIQFRSSSVESFLIFFFGFSVFLFCFWKIFLWQQSQMTYDSGIGCRMSRRRVTTDDGIFLFLPFGFLSKSFVAWIEIYDSTVENRKMVVSKPNRVAVKVIQTRQSTRIKINPNQKNR